MATRVVLFRSFSSQGRQRVRSIKTKHVFSTPFETHLGAATARHRRPSRLQRSARSCINDMLVRQHGTKDGTPTPNGGPTKAPSSSRSPRRVLEIDGTSEISQQSATATHRRARKLDSSGASSSKSGSIVASMSATLKHRRNRQPVNRKGGDRMVVPSSLTLPISSTSAVNPSPDESTEKVIDSDGMQQSETAVNNGRATKAMAYAGAAVATGATAIFAINQLSVSF